MNQDNKTVDHQALVHFIDRRPAVRMYSYPLPGGIVNESIYSGMVGKEQLLGTDFEFASRELHLAFPNISHIANMIKRIYCRHPLRHHIYHPNDSGLVFPMSIICFRGVGVYEIYSLRSWLSEIFIPVIWPDLLRDGMKIIIERRECVSNPDLLEELLSDHSHVKNDPISLSLNK